MNIAIFGFMGTGKSAVAQALARRLNLRWTDMDKVIESRESLSIEKIFERHGEDFFRGLERVLVQEIVRMQDLVVSTGGGVVLDDRNISDFIQWGSCVCLNASCQSIYERTAHRHGGRPLMTRLVHEAKTAGHDPLKKIQDLLELRRPYYEKIPFQIDTTDKSVNDIVETILAVLTHDQ